MHARGVGNLTPPESNGFEVTSSKDDDPEFVTKVDVRGKRKHSPSESATSPSEISQTATEKSDEDTKEPKPKTKLVTSNVNEHIDNLEKSSEIQVQPTRPSVITIQETSQSLDSDGPKTKRFKTEQSFNADPAHSNHLTSTGLITSSTNNRTGKKFLPKELQNNETKAHSHVPESIIGLNPSISKVSVKEGLVPHAISNNLKVNYLALVN